MLKANDNSFCSNSNGRFFCLFSLILFPLYKKLNSANKQAAGSDVHYREDYSQENTIVFKQRVSHVSR